MALAERQASGNGWSAAVVRGYDRNYAYVNVIFPSPGLPA
jgi:hypothetical protein